MTTEEKRDQRGRLLVDLEDAELNLAHLQEKAMQEADLLDRAADAFRRNAALEVSAEEAATGLAPENRLTDEYQAIPSYADVLKLIDELRAGRAKVWTLRSRKARINGGVPKHF